MPRIKQLGLIELTYAYVSLEDRTDFGSISHLQLILSKRDLVSSIIDYQHSDTKHLYALRILYTGEIGPQAVYAAIGEIGWMDHDAHLKLQAVAGQMQTRYEQYIAPPSDITPLDRDVVVSLFTENIQFILQNITSREEAMNIFTFNQESQDLFLAHRSRIAGFLLREELELLRDTLVSNSTNADSSTFPTNATMRIVYMDEVLRHVDAKFGAYDNDKQKRAELRKKLCFIANVSLDAENAITDRIAAELNAAFPTLNPMPQTIGAPWCSFYTVVKHGLRTIRPETKRKLFQL